MKKRITALLLCLAFVLSLAPAMAVAEGEGGECPHENWYNFFIPWEDVTYEPVDNAYHIATGTFSFGKHCTDCV